MSYAEHNPPDRREFPNRLPRSQRRLLREIDHRAEFEQGEALIKEAMRILSVELGKPATYSTVMNKRDGVAGPFVVALLKEWKAGAFVAPDYTGTIGEETLAIEHVLLYICAPGDETPTGDNPGAGIVQLAHALFGATRRFAIKDSHGKFVTWLSSRAPGPVRDDIACYLDGVGKWQEIQRFTEDEEEDQRAAEIIMCEKCGDKRPRGLVDVAIDEVPEDAKSILARFSCLLCGTPLPHFWRGKTHWRLKPVAP